MSEVAFCIGPKKTWKAPKVRPDAVLAPPDDPDGGGSSTCFAAPCEALSSGEEPFRTMGASFCRSEADEPTFRKTEFMVHVLCFGV